MSNKAIIVTGAEGTGTNITTQILVNAGCVNNAENYTLYDDDFPKIEYETIGDSTSNFPKLDPLIVWRRSVPHGGMFPHLIDIIRKLQESDYEVCLVVTIREIHANLASQTKDRDVKFNIGDNNNAGISLQNIQKAYKHIFNAIIECDIQYIMISLESLILQSRETIYYMLDFLGLNVDKSFKTEIFNANLKWYNSIEVHDDEVITVEIPEHIVHLSTKQGNEPMGMIRVSVNNTVDHWIITDRISDAFGHVTAVAGSTDTSSLEFKKLNDDNKVTIQFKPAGKNMTNITHTVEEWITLHGEDTKLLGITERKVNPDPTKPAPKPRPTRKSIHSAIISKAKAK